MSSFLGEIGIFTSIFLGFQALVLIVFIYWLARRVMTERKAFKEVEENLRLIANPDPEQLGEIFAKVEGSRYYTLWLRYRQRVRLHEPYQDAFYTYFDAEVMRRVLGYRSEVETISQVHISLGVLGSLLSVLWAWSGGEIHQGDMIAALYPFLWGVLLLILWLIVDRILVSPLEGKVDHHAGIMADVLLRDHHEQWMNTWKDEIVEVLEKGLSPLLQQMKWVEEERMEEREGVLEQLRSIDHLLQTMEREGARHDAQFMEQMEKLGLMVHTMQEATTGLVSVIPKLREVVQGLDTLKEELRQVQEEQQQALMELAAGREQHNALVERTVKEMKQYVKEISDQVTRMQNQWEETKEEFIALRSSLERSGEKLERSGEKFASNIDKGLDTTFKLFDRELKEAMKKFSQLNRNFTDSHEKLLRELEELPRRLESVIESKECHGKQEKLVQQSLSLE